MKSILSSLAATALLVARALAQETTTVNVTFAPGTNHQRYEDSIEGSESFDYIVPGEAGQRLTIVYTSDNMGSYINLYPPGSDAAMHVGANLGNRFEGTLPETGEYRVHVFLMPNAAHRGEIAHFAIELTLGDDHADAEEPDFADGLSGGPDFWEVKGVAEGEKLSVRSGPSTSQEVVSEVANGTLLRNLGCKMEAGSRWCHVRTPGDGSVTGWVAGRCLAEAAAAGASGGKKVRLSDDPDAPALFVRSSGEIEVSFKRGCGALFDADGTRITAGSSCSTDELRRASEAIRAYPR